MRVTPLDPHAPRAAAALTAYMTEVLTVCGMGGESLAHAVDDVADYCPPMGTFLVVLADDEVVACVGLREVETGVGEIKRMWVSPELRGQGVGALLLEAVEQQGFHTLRLDTHEGLTAAMHLYRSHGYSEIPAYNDNPDATHFFEKRLRTIQE